MLKNRESNCSNRGVTMLELLIGIAVLSVVGVMTTSLLSFSVRMYRSTNRYADIRTEGQMISRRLSSLIMGAHNIYLEETEAGVLLFTGDITNQDDILYYGEIFCFDRKTNSLYQNSTISMRATGKDGELTSDDVEQAFASEGDIMEFLISDKIKELDFSISPQLKESDKLIENSNFYRLDTGFTIKYTLTLGYLDGEDYVLNSGTTPRNKLKFLWVSYKESEKGL